MKNLLLTGCCGFIGSNFVNYISLKYPHLKIIVLDRLDYCGSIENIHKTSLHNTEIIIGDIGNRELVIHILKQHNIDTVINFAAMTSVDSSFFNSIEFTKSNVLSFHNLLECCRVYQNETNKIEKFIQISTDECISSGDIEDAIVRDENALVLPTNPYSASKAAAEMYAKAYYYSYKLPILITRCNNVYGIQQYPEKIIPKFVCKLIDNKPLTIHGNGSSRRDFIHIDDAITAFETILLKGTIGETYNISSDHKDYSVIETAQTLVKLFHGENVNFTEYITFVPDRPFNDYRYLISSDKLRLLGWKPIKNDFETNLIEIIKWYKLNRKRYNLD